MSEILATASLRARLAGLAGLRPGWGLLWLEENGAAPLVFGSAQPDPPAVAALAGLFLNCASGAEHREPELVTLVLPNGESALAARLPAAPPAQAVLFSLESPAPAQITLFQAAAGLAAALVLDDLRQSAALAQARQEEQARLGLRLHDTLAQSLFAISLEAETAARAGNAVEPARLDKIRRLARRSSDTLRSQLITLQNQPASAGDSLAPLMQARAVRFEQLTGVPVSLVIAPETAQLSAEQVEGIYRLYAALLQAIGELGGAHGLFVQLARSAAEWVLSLEDDVVLADPAAQRRRAQDLSLDETAEELLDGLGGAATTEIAPPGNVILRVRFSA